LEIGNLVNRYTDNNTVRLECWYLVMCMVNLLPSFSLKMHSYPECIGEVSTRYKSTAAESRMRSRQWELHHCSIVYTVTDTNVVSCCSKIQNSLVLA